jgi:RNA polymerase sigma-70 factor (ECF subfamily)
MSSDSHPTLALPAAALPLPAHVTDAAAQARVLALFDEYSPRLLRYVRSCGLEPAIAEDVVQEVFLSLYRHVALGRPEDNLRAWLFQVAHNLALRHHRQRRRRVDGHAWDEEAAAGLVDPAANPEQVLAETQALHSMRAALGALSPRDRQCLSLRAEGLRYRDIARVLGMSLGGVAKAIARAIDHLSSGHQR